MFFIQAPFVRDVGVAGSNLVTPTTDFRFSLGPTFKTLWVPDWVPRFVESQQHFIGPAGPKKRGTRGSGARLARRVIFVITYLHSRSRTAAGNNPEA